MYIIITYINWYGMNCWSMNEIRTTVLAQLYYIHYCVQAYTKICHSYGSGMLCMCGRYTAEGCIDFQ